MIPRKSHLRPNSAWQVPRCWRTQHKHCSWFQNDRPTCIAQSLVIVFTCKAEPNRTTPFRDNGDEAEWAATLASTNSDISFSKFGLDLVCIINTITKRGILQVDLSFWNQLWSPQVWLARLIIGIQWATKGLRKADCREIILPWTLKDIWGTSEQTFRDH